MILVIGNSTITIMAKEDRIVMKINPKQQFKPFTKPTYKLSGNPANNVSIIRISSTQPMMTLLAKTLMLLLPKKALAKGNLPMIIEMVMQNTPRTQKALEYA